MKVCCLFSLESPNRGNCNEYTQYTIFNIKKKIILNYPKSAAMGFFLGTQERVLLTAVANKPSVFEQLKFYCIRSCFSFQNKLEDVDPSYLR